MTVTERPTTRHSTAEQAAGVEPERIDGFAPIRQYAAIGDGRSVALVAADGAVDWLAFPTLADPPVFGALLDPEQGGHVRLAPRGVQSVERRYIEATNVLQSTFHTDDGTVRVTDALNVGSAGRLPWSELVRRVEGIDGTVEVDWEVAPGRRLGRSMPWAEEKAGTLGLRVDDQTLAVVTDEMGTPRNDGRAVSGTFVTRPGSDHLLAVTSADQEPVHIPSADQVRSRLESTVASWKRWHDRVHVSGRWSDAVLRSALALKLLIYAPTGAIAAAPTTGLPEAIGGSRNYDYRFAWIRDMSFIIESLTRLELREESHGALSWLLGTVRRTAPDLYPFYSMQGEVPESEQELPVPGYRHSQPALAGNGAAQQTQLGTFGDLLEATWLYVQQGNGLDDRTAALVAQCANRVCDLWQGKDAGLWELGDRQHYTSSKIGCWAALDRAVKLAEGGHLNGDHRRRWEMERDAIAEWVRRHCWSERKGAYTMYPGTEHLDCAVLLAGRTGFDRGERLAGTVDAVRSELGRGPLLYRYSGMADKEGAFLACSFWMIEALAYTGRTDEAAHVMDEMVALANDVGLFSEEMDPHSRALLGNFPMGLTHLALVNAARTLQDLTGS